MRDAEWVATYRTENPIVAVKKLKKWFPVRIGTFATLFRKSKYIHAVDGIDFELKKGEILCLVGESGCGKTTTAKMMLGLIRPTSGKVYFKGNDIFSLSKEELRKLRIKMQMIFQNPYGCMNPKMTILDIVAEPLVVNRLVGAHTEKEEKVSKMLETVELKPAEDFMDKHPHELSGGQRQRVAIARALILQPTFIVADEPVSMLDVSLRIGILNLLLQLRKEFDLTYLFITHDLTQAKYVGDVIAVMYLGRIVEKGLINDVIDEPRHPYTEALISNVPVIAPRTRKRIIIKGEIPDPINLPEGCRFHPRCPKARKICSRVEPKMVETTKGHHVACHLHA